MVSEEVIQGLNLARDVLETSDASIVVVKNDQILLKKTGDGIKPILETVGELKDEMQGSIVGDKGSVKIVLRRRDYPRFFAGTI